MKRIQRPAMTPAMITPRNSASAGTMALVGGLTAVTDIVFSVRRDFLPATSATAMQTVAVDRTGG
ncbi:MAG TPA: hypothetical protein VGA09_10520 [Candidatus Binatia bacterium]